eukprot:1178329-Prorocentrum_minimum.AAC.1
MEVDVIGIKVDVIGIEVDVIGIAVDVIGYLLVADGAGPAVLGTCLWPMTPDQPFCGDVRVADVVANGPAVLRAREPKVERAEPVAPVGVRRVAGELAEGNARRAHALRRGGAAGVVGQVEPVPVPVTKHNTTV